MLAQEDVQSFPRPPVIQPVDEEIIAVLGGQEVLRTRDALRVLETHHAPTYYVPRAQILAEFTEVPGRTFCEWKGRARYWSLSVSGARAERCAWDYPEPTPGFVALRDHVAIYAHALDRCSVGGIAVQPQPGNFYGGWVTPNLVGTIKGAPGTEGW